jgi:hypothetical protein
MTSLKDRPHGEYVDLERVIAKHLSAESARLLRDDPELASDVLSDDAIKRVQEGYYVDGLWTTPKRQLAFWKSYYAELGWDKEDFDALQNLQPSWPKKAKDGGEVFLVLMPVASSGDLPVLSLDLLLRRRVIPIHPQIRFDQRVGSLVWRVLRVGPRQAGCGHGHASFLLAALLMHPRWAKRLGVAGTAPVATFDQTQGSFFAYNVVQGVGKATPGVFTEGNPSPWVANQLTLARL